MPPKSCASVSIFRRRFFLDNAPPEGAILPNTSRRLRRGCWPPSILELDPCTPCHPCPKAASRPRTGVKWRSLPTWTHGSSGRRWVADDLLQGFVCDQVVAADLLADADRGRGRFRTFLLTALDRYVARVWRTETAGKRAPAGGIASVDDCSNLKSAALPASDAFDLAWARQVVTRALEQMRVECQQSGREQLWELFRCRTVAPLFDGTAAPRYQELVRRFGFESPSQASNALVTAKRMFARVLRSIVGEYSSGREEIERELTDLLDVFAKAHPRGASRELQSQ